MARDDVNKKHPSQVEHLPGTGKVFAIFEDASYSSNGGYDNEPSYSTNYIDMQVFPTEAEWKAEIERRHKQKPSYYVKAWKAVVLTIPEVKVTVAVDVEVKT